MRHRPFLVAALLLALVPVTARAEETITPAATAMPLLISAAPVSLAEDAHAVRLIEQRIDGIDDSARAGEVALNPDGTPLWKQRAYVPLMPASTMKVVTATVALELLGPTWKPVTSVEYDESTGTLTLVGGGDPQLTSAQLGALADRTVAALGERSASPARLTVDDSLFASPSLQPGVLASQQPSEERPVRALVVDGARSKDSSLDAGRKFRTMLAQRNVLVPFKGRAASDAEPVASIEGYRLQSTLKAMLWYSDNDIAEMAFRLSAIAAGRQGTWAAARSTVLETLDRLGVPTKDLTVVDGSGLSRNNRLTPFAIAATLHAANSETRTAVLASLLPAAGLEGTLRTRYTKAPAKCVRGAVKAKTGSLHDVIALAGYAPTKAGTQRTFAMLVNGVRNSAVARNRTRAALDALAAAVSGC